MMGICRSLGQAGQLPQRWRLRLEELLLSVGIAASGDLAEIFVERNDQLSEGATRAFADGSVATGHVNLGLGTKGSLGPQWLDVEGQRGDSHPSAARAAVHGPHKPLYNRVRR